MNDTLTAVPGVRVGHAEVAGGGSGCTVVLGPFRAGAEVVGMATGTRELDALSPLHLVPEIDALVLTGGSAFGLAAADGVAAWLEERGMGFPTPAARVPIVPAAVIYDLAEGRARPDATTGRAACEAASQAPVVMGAVGAGTGARVAKGAGFERSSPGGVGSAALRMGAWTVGALAVVNAVGEVVDGEGRIVAGARRGDGSVEPLEELLMREAEVKKGDRGLGPVESTTLCVVATDAPLARTDLGRLARMASSALPRRIRPVFTPFDGDVVFALSTGGPRGASGRATEGSAREGAADRDPGSESSRFDPRALLRVGVAASRALELSIERAVRGAG